jgi:hypothetical protein
MSRRVIDPVFIRPWGICGGDDMRKKKDEAAWNKEVLRNVKPIQKGRSWLNLVKKYDLSWEETRKGDRLLC